jgi:hypothetical protein
MTASINMGSFVIVAVMILAGVAMISDITSQSGIEASSAPLNGAFTTISTLLNSGLGLAAIAVFILGGMIVLKVFDYF